MPSSKGVKIKKHIMSLYYSVLLTIIHKMCRKYVSLLLPLYMLTWRTNIVPLFPHVTLFFRQLYQNTNFKMSTGGLQFVSERIELRKWRSVAQYVVVLHIGQPCLVPQVDPHKRKGMRFSIKSILSDVSSLESVIIL